MAMTDYAFCKGLEYPSIVAASQRVAWTVDDIFANRRFDTTRRTVPDSWVGTEHLAFLDDSERRTLNHIRAFSYAHLLGNYEEFIPVQMSEVAEQDWHDDRSRMRALFRFGEEEMKHQQLFRRTEDVLEASCGHSIGRYFDPDKLRLTAFTKAVLGYPLLPRFLLLTAFEFGNPTPLSQIGTSKEWRGQRPALRRPESSLDRGEPARQVGCPRSRALGRGHEPGGGQ